MKHTLTAAVAAFVTVWVTHDLALPAPTIVATFFALWGFGVLAVRFAEGEGLL